MVFSSIPFLYYFLPAVLLLYFLSPRKLKNGVLLLSSLFFYAWGEPIYVFLMLASIIAGYFLALLIERYRKKRVSRLFLLLSVLFCVGILSYFKYADFFISGFSAATGLSVPLLNVALPIGISFFTFQLLSYTIDVYRGEVPAQKSFVALATYISMFPQLIAGPIVRYRDIEASLTSRRESFPLAAEGARRFILGLAKKVLLANRLGELCDVFKASSDTSVLFFWLYAPAVMLHIYFDFSGYSDMAIGLGKIFGFSFSENFNFPYISRSITEFWRRWHISLGTWFRDYVYIPLGGNRVSVPRHIINILAVWLLTGLWHGAAWTFVVWGLYFAVFLTAEKYLFGGFLKKHRILSHIYVLLTVAISFVIFDAESLSAAFLSIKSLFGLSGLPLMSAELSYCFGSYFIILFISLIGATPLPKLLFERLHNTRRISAVLAVAEPIFLALLLVLCTAYLVDGSFNPFLYFKF